MGQVRALLLPARATVKVLALVQGLEMAPVLEKGLLYLRLIPLP